MKMLWTLALKELRDGFRNRWIAAAIIVLGILALVLSVLGSAPTGSVRVSELDISVISLASLSVYLIPLIALMLSYDALVGEFERGTMMLLLAYPVTRWQIIVGKFLGHVLILLIAIVVGYGGAVVALALVTDSGTEGWQAYASMMASSLLLGAVFIALGYLVSVIVRERATAAGAAIGLVFDVDAG
jgi:Cu-processing system permease protein